MTLVLGAAPGYNKGKDKLKASFHLVWPQLVVNAPTAHQMRDITLAEFRVLPVDSDSLAVILKISIDIVIS